MLTILALGACGSSTDIGANTGCANFLSMGDDDQRRAIEFMQRDRNKGTSRAQIAEARAAALALCQGPGRFGAINDIYNSRGETATTEAPPPAQALPGTTTAGGGSSSPYASRAIGYRTSDNWSYTFRAHFAGEFTIRAIKDISQSPPGRARLEFQIDTPRYTLNVENATPGRNAPTMVFDLDAAYFPFRHKSTYDTFYADGPPTLGPGDRCTVDNEIWNYKTEYLQKPRREAGSRNYGGVVCAGPDPGSRSGGSVEVPEAAADAVIADLANPPRAIVFTLPRPRTSTLGCDVIFFPDGTVSIGKSLRDAACGNASGGLG